MLGAHCRTDGADVWISALELDVQPVWLEVSAALVSQLDAEP